MHELRFTSRGMGVGMRPWWTAAGVLGYHIAAALLAASLYGSHANLQARGACLPLNGFEQVWIPSGDFIFGSNSAYLEEGPMRRVSVAGFWMDRHEVTNRQFAAFVRETHYVTTAERVPRQEDFPEVPAASLVPASAVFALEGMNEGDAAGWRYVPGANWQHPFGPASSSEGREDYPVVHVSDEDATAYAKWLGRELPTEVEWEYASLGGEDSSDDFVKRTHEREHTPELAPVSRSGANGYGLEDMIGNVWEWTSVWYEPSHARLESASSSDPRESGAQVRVIKGGSFLCSPDFCWRARPSARQGQDIRLGTNHLGFRTISRTGVAGRCKRLVNTHSIIAAAVLRPLER